MVNEKDLKILEILKTNCKLPAREISKVTGLPITTIHNRIKKMEKEGIIKNYVAQVDNTKIGQSIQAFIQVRLKPSSPESVTKTLAHMREVNEIYVISGSTDILVKVSTKDVDSLQEFLIDKLRKIKNIERTTTSVILKKVDKDKLNLLSIT